MQSGLNVNSLHEEVDPAELVDFSGCKSWDDAIRVGREVEAALEHMRADGCALDTRLVQRRPAPPSPRSRRTLAACAPCLTSRDARRSASGGPKGGRRPPRTRQRATRTAGAQDAPGRQQRRQQRIRRREKTRRPPQVSRRARVTARIRGCVPSVLVLPSIGERGGGGASRRFRPGCCCTCIRYFRVPVLNKYESLHTIRRAFARAKTSVGFGRVRRQSTPRRRTVCCRRRNASARYATAMAHNAVRSANMIVVVSPKEKNWSGPTSFPVASTDI